MAEDTTDTTAESFLCSEEMKPISSFINDRRKMLEVAFSTVDADKLKEIIPPFLKDTTLDELKLICYEELCCLTDDALKSILGDSNSDESSITEDKKDTSSMETVMARSPVLRSVQPDMLNKTSRSSNVGLVCHGHVCLECSSWAAVLHDIHSEALLECVCPLFKLIAVSGSHEPRTFCGFEACKSEDTTTSMDSKNKDILEIGISEEEVSHLLKEIPNISKDTLDVSSPSPSIVSTSGKKHYTSDEASTIPKDSLHNVEVEPDALDEDSLELWELENQARSIRSMIMQCDAERENVSEVSDKSARIDSSDCRNRKYNSLDGINETKEHQELEPLSFVCTPAFKVALRSCKAKETDLTSTNKLALCDHNEGLVSGDFTVMEPKSAENSPRRVVHGNLNDGDNETCGGDSSRTSTLGSPCNYNSTEVESAFHNTDQLQISISALNGDSLSKKDMQMNSHSAGKVKEKNIHKVVETSKMCTKLRERIKRTQQLKKFKEGNIKAKTIILGTVEEYKSLNMK